MSTDYDTARFPSAPQVATEESGPYPERLSQVAGVRQRTELVVVPDRKVASVPAGTPHNVFGASLKVVATPVESTWPWRSVTIAVLAQLVLTAVAILKAPDPTVIVVVAILQLVAGLVLVMAETISIYGR